MTAGAVSYTANCLHGGSVALRLVDTRHFRWLHHALFLSTVGLSTAAALALGADRDPAVLMLLPAAAPFAAVPRISARSPRHPLVALAAAPFVFGALHQARRRSS
jgi:hypothetical protein